MKYHSKKIKLNGHTFDSQAEAKYYQDLLFMERAGLISNLNRQPTFKLLDSYTVKTNKTKKGISKVPEMTYTPDFQYRQDSRLIVVEVKGFKTTDYKMRQKLFMAKAKEYGVSEFIEVIKGIKTSYFFDVD